MNWLFRIPTLIAAAFAIGMVTLMVHDTPRATAQQTGQLSCSQNAQYDASTNGATRIFTANATSGRSVYICGYTVNVGAVATNVRFSYGTGTNCGTGTTSLTPLWVLPAAGQVFDDAGIWHGLTVPPANDLCIFTSAGNPVQAIIYFTYQ